MTRRMAIPEWNTAKMQWMAGIGACLLVILPALIMFFYIRSFGVNLVYWDQWDFLPYLEKFFQGTLTIEDIFSQHNEHRLFFPRLIMLVLAGITHYNTVAEMYVSWVICICSGIVVFLLFRGMFKGSCNICLSFIPVSWIIFSIRQYENLLWGFQIQIFLCVLGIVIAIAMLEFSEKNINFFLVSIAGAVIASYSFMNGLSVWPAGFVMIWLSSNHRTQKLILWVISGAITVFLYFYQWAPNPGHPSALSFLYKPIDAITYFFANIGAFYSPVTMNDPIILVIALIAGVLVFAACLVILAHAVRSNMLSRIRPWIGFIAFAFFSTLFLTLGRGGFGPYQGLASRYVTFGQFWIIGLYCMLLFFVIAHPENSFLARSYNLLVIFLVIGICVGILGGFLVGQKTATERSTAASYLADYSHTGDNELSIVYPDADIVRKRVHFLDINHLNIFRGINNQPN